MIALAPRQISPTTAARSFSEIDRSLQELTAITGLKAKKPIHYDLITRDKVNEFLKDRVKESTKPDELRAEEITLKKLGFVPADFNLEKSTVDLLTEQAAAFYDYHKKRLFLTDWAPSAMQESALVHELAHALADQNFHLERFIKQGGQSDDSELARMAVMEGPGHLADDRSHGAARRPVGREQPGAARRHERRLPTKRLVAVSRCSTACRSTCARR